MSDIVEAAVQAVADEATQTKRLDWLMELLAIDEAMKDLIDRRWKRSWPTSVKAFSPYASWIAVVTVAFYLGLTRGLIGIRPSNRIDLEYLLYLPFCCAFSTGDRIQGKLATALCSRLGCTFIPKDALKAKHRGNCRRTSERRCPPEGTFCQPETPLDQRLREPFSATATSCSSTPIGAQNAFRHPGTLLGLAH